MPFKIREILLLSNGKNRAGKAMRAGHPSQVLLFLKRLMIELSFPMLGPFNQCRTRGSEDKLTCVISVAQQVGILAKCRPESRSYKV
jgi:hypothetical protein